MKQARSLKRTFVLLLKKLRFLTAVSVRLARLTGKSRYHLHPKHFLTSKPWFEHYLQKNDKVLDVGCGNGQNMLKMATKVKAITGVDYDEKQLSIGRSLAKEKQFTNVHFLLANLEMGLPFKSEEFDAVLFLDVLEHLRKRDFVLGETKRVLKDGGYLFLSLPNKNTSWKKLQRSVGLNSFADPDHKIEYSFAQIARLCNNHHLKIIATEQTTYDTPLAPLVDLVGGVSLSLYRPLASWKRSMVEYNPAETTGYRIVCKKM